MSLRGGVGLIRQFAWTGRSLTSGSHRAPDRGGLQSLSLRANALAGPSRAFQDVQRFGLGLGLQRGAPLSAHAGQGNGAVRVSIFYRQEQDGSSSRQQGGARVAPVGALGVLLALLEGHDGSPALAQPGDLEDDSEQSWDSEPDDAMTMSKTMEENVLRDSLKAGSVTAPEVRLKAQCLHTLANIVRDYEYTRSKELEWYTDGPGVCSTKKILRCCVPKSRKSPKAKPASLSTLGPVPSQSSLETTVAAGTALPDAAAAEQAGCISYVFSQRNPKGGERFWELVSVVGGPHHRMLCTSRALVPVARIACLRDVQNVLRNRAPKTSSQGLMDLISPSVMTEFSSSRVTRIKALYHAAEAKKQEADYQKLPAWCSEQARVNPGSLFILGVMHKNVLCTRKYSSFNGEVQETRSPPHANFTDNSSLAVYSFLFVAPSWGAGLFRVAMQVLYIPRRDSPAAHGADHHRERPGCGISRGAVRAVLRH